MLPSPELAKSASHETRLSGIPSHGLMVDSSGLECGLALHESCSKSEIGECGSNAEGEELKVATRHDGLQRLKGTCWQLIGLLMRVRSASSNYQGE